MLLLWLTGRPSDAPSIGIMILKAVVICCRGTGMRLPWQVAKAVCRLALFGCYITILQQRCVCVYVLVCKCLFVSVICWPLREHTACTHTAIFRLIRSEHKPKQIHHTTQHTKHIHTTQQTQQHITRTTQTHAHYARHRQHTHHTDTHTLHTLVSNTLLHRC